MKSHSLFIYLILSIIMTSCGFNSHQKKEKTTEQFNQYGISFNIPDGWNVSEAKEGYVCVERTGWNESGMVIFTISPYIEEEDFLHFFIESFYERTELSKLEFTQQKAAIYGQYEGFSSNYTFLISIIPFNGTYTVISDKNTVVCITEQGANEDSKKNADGFKIIKESFQIETINYPENIDSIEYGYN